MAYEPEEGLEGGELAARLSPRQRMDMVTGGYNPLSAADVERYFKRQSPAEGLAEHAGVSKYKNLGEGRFDDKRDYAAISKEFHGEVPGAEFDEEVDPKSSMRNQMEGYGGGFNREVDLNDKLTSLMERRTVTAKPKQAIRQPISQPKQLLTEETKARKIGYLAGIKYINAFINLIKAPTNENRGILIAEMNKMVMLEEKIHPGALKYYRAGIATAETALYKKIKGNA